MVQFIPYATLPSAVARSAAEAAARGAGGLGDVTQLWWDVKANPNGPGACIIGVDPADPPRSGGKAPVAEPPDWLASAMAGTPTAR